MCVSLSSLERQTSCSFPCGSPSCWALCLSEREDNRSAPLTLYLASSDKIQVVLMTQQAPNQQTMFSIYCELVVLLCASRFLHLSFIFHKVHDTFQGQTGLASENQEWYILFDSMLWDRHRCSVLKDINPRREKRGWNRLPQWSTSS